MYKYDYVI